MGLKKVLLGAVSAMVFSAGVASADFDRDGWYYGLEAGWSGVSKTNFDVPHQLVDFDGGWVGLGTVGYALADSKWRFEGEIGFRTNDANTFNGRLVTDGRLDEWTAMANAIYDLRLSDRWGLALGAGLGVDNPRYDAPDGAESNDFVFAMQGIAGVTYRISQHWDLAVNYRYLWANQADLDPGLQFPEGQMDLRKHSVTIGFRYGYNEPPAPPAEPPIVVPPPTPKQFIVFFGFNKCNITAEADAVLSEAASAAKSTGSASVKVVGHTDTSGSPKYNQKLSECRANAVKTNLVGKGVGEGSISTSGKGESELMVQTGDGVKEPQNRRATVDLQ